MKIILGSASPRRSELLRDLGFDFTVSNINCNETFPLNLPCNQVAEFIAQKKSDAYKDLVENEILITADTVVECDDEIFGKPKDRDEARNMLLKLSDKVHKVHTALVFRTLSFSISITDTAEVKFGEINEEEANYYIDKFKPTDKAGSYGIQEWIGMTKIEKINGSFYTIMGFPTHIVYRELMKFPEIRDSYYEIKG